MKIIILGGAGFIGSHVVDYLVNEGHEVIVYDNLSTGKKENINENAKFVYGDITNLDSLVKASKDVDVIIHLAAKISVNESFIIPKEYEKVNVIGTLNVIKTALENNVKKIVFSSSCAIYGDPIEIPIQETSKLEILSPYALTKYVDEIYFKLLLENKIDYTILRYFNVYGPRQDPNSEYSGVISKFIYNALNGNPIKIHGSGDQTRDFIYVKDVAKITAISAIKNINGIYNVGTGKEISIKELAQLILNISKRKNKIIYDKPRPGDIKRSVADISKLSQKIDFKLTPIEEGLEKTVSWFKERLNIK